MTHLPYILAAYGITLFSLSVLWSLSWTGLKSAQRKLASLKKIH